MKITSLLLLVLISMSFASFASDAAGPSVRLTDGGSFMTADGTSITCTGRTIKKQVSCYCNSENNLFIVHSKKQFIASFKSTNQCLKAVRERPDCN